MVANGVVYAATPSGTVAALDAASGAERWSVDLESGISANLALGDGVVHVPTLDGSHVVLSMDDGSVVWEARLGNAATTSPLVLDRADRVAFLQQGQVVAVGDHRTLLRDEPRYRAVVTREVEEVTS